jgi:hypothetical protein
MTFKLLFCFVAGKKNPVAKEKWRRRVNFDPGSNPSVVW